MNICQNRKQSVHNMSTDKEMAKHLNKSENSLTNGKTHEQNSKFWVENI